MTNARSGRWGIIAICWSVIAGMLIGYYLLASIWIAVPLAVVMGGLAAAWAFLVYWK